MISGRVNLRMEPSLVVTVHDAGGNTHSLEAMVDTGFNGFMTLPNKTIRQLGLKKSGDVQIILADGRAQSCAVYRAVVDWDGIPVDMEVEAADFKPLVGMALLRGFRLNDDVEKGGLVIIEPLNPATINPGP